MKDKIIIRIEGGLVQCVYSNLKELDIEVLDEDYLDDDSEEEERNVLREKTKELITHYL